MVRQHLIFLGLFALALPLVWWGDGVLFKPVSGPLPVDLRGLVFGAYLLWLLIYAAMSSLAFFLLKTKGLFMLHGVSAILAVVLLISGFTVHGMAQDRHSRHNADKRYVVELARDACMVAHIRITAAEMVRPLGDNTEDEGLRLFLVQGDVVEAIKGELDGTVQFTIAQAAPLTPPASGEFIVGLERGGHGALYFSNESERWIPAAPNFLAAAREAR